MINVAHPSPPFLAPLALHTAPMEEGGAEELAEAMLNLWPHPGTNGHLFYREVSRIHPDMLVKVERKITDGASIIEEKYGIR